MKTLSLIILFIALAFGQAYAEDKPQALFQQFVERGDNFDVSVADLYAGDAKIHAYRIYPHGLEKNMEITGAQWKELIKRVMPMAKAKNDISTYSSINVSKRGKGFKIKADRYSVRKCYTDKGYYMILSPTVSGDLLIVEEYIETQSESGC